MSFIRRLANMDLGADGLLLTIVLTVLVCFAGGWFMMRSADKNDVFTYHRSDWGRDTRESWRMVDRDPLPSRAERARKEALLQKQLAEEETQRAKRERIAEWAATPESKVAETQPAVSASTGQKQAER